MLEACERVGSGDMTSFASESERWQSRLRRAAGRITAFAPPTTPGRYSRRLTAAAGARGTHPAAYCADTLAAALTGRGQTPAFDFARDSWSSQGRRHADSDI